MRRSIMVVLTAAIAILGEYGSASAQGVGIELYVGPPPAYYYGPGPSVVYDAEPGAYTYYSPGITVYRRRSDDPSPNNTGAYFRKLDREGRGGNAGN